MFKLAVHVHHDPDHASEHTDLLLRILTLMRMRSALLSSSTALGNGGPSTLVLVLGFQEIPDHTLVHALVQKAALGATVTVLHHA